MPRSWQQSKSSAPTAYRPPPVVVRPSVDLAPKQSVGSILKESFAFGVGQASGFHAVNALLSPFSKPKNVEQKETAPPAPSKPCDRERTIFEQCLLLDNYTGHNCIQEQNSLAKCIVASKKLEEY